MIFLDVDGSLLGTRKRKDVPNLCGFLIIIVMLMLFIQHMERSLTARTISGIPKPLRINLRQLQTPESRSTSPSSMTRQL